MVRYRQHNEIQYGKFREALDLWKQIAALSVKRGWPNLTLWSPVVGRANMMIIEIDYPDMATFERLNDEFQTDAEVMGLDRSSAQHVIQSTSHDELLFASPELA